MPTNRYNPEEVGDQMGDWEKAKFSDLNNGELFWLNTEKSDNNHAYRKTNETEAFNVKLQQPMTFNRHQNVFYKM